MSVYRRKGIWYIDYYANGYRRRECAGESKKEAERLLGLRRAEVLRGKYNLKKKVHVRFDAFAEEYLAYSKANKKSFTRDITSLKRLVPYFKTKTLAQIIPQDIEKYKIKRMKQVRPSTVNRELACLKHMYNMAIRWDKADSNPVQKVRFFREERKSRRILTAEEEEKLLQVSPPHLKSIIITALNTGMRKGELLNLTWDRVDMKNEFIIVEKTKSGKIRTIPMNNLLTETLKYVRNNSDNEYVFCKEDGSPYKCIKTVFTTALRNAGIEKFRFHDLRHTFASRLVMSGVDLVTVKEIMGHKSIETTLIYSHPSPAHMKQAVETLSVQNGHKTGKSSHKSVTSKNPKFVSH